MPALEMGIGFAKRFVWLWNFVIVIDAGWSYPRKSIVALKCCPRFFASNSPFQLQRLVFVFTKARRSIFPDFPIQLFQCKRFHWFGIKPLPLQIVTAVMILEKQKTLQIQTAKQLKVKKRLNQDTLIFAIGSSAYSLIELLWRGYTHWTMMITGGICFLVLFRVFSRIVHAKLWKKCAVGACVITGIEFMVGCIVNLWLQMNVWDYSFLPFNVLGQVCPLYTLLWALLSIPIIYLSGKIKQRLFD